MSRRSLVALLTLAVLAVACWDERPEAAIGTGEHELYIVALPDGEPKLIARSREEQHITVRWKDDSRRFAYITGTDASTEIRIVEPNNPRRPTGNIERPPYPVYTLAWSSDLLFLQEHQGATQHLYAVREDGHEVVELGEFRAGYGEYWPWAVSPDGSVFLRRGGSEEVALARMRLDGSIEEYDLPPSNFGSIELSPSGAFFAWSDHCGQPGENDGLWIASVESLTPRRINNACGVTDLAWSPDESEIAFTAVYTTARAEPEESGGLYVVDIGSGNTSRITDPAPPGVSYDGTPSNEEPVEVGVKWAADGETFYVNRNLTYGCDHCRNGQLLVVTREGAENVIGESGKYPELSEEGMFFTTDEGLWYAPDGSKERLLFPADENYAFHSEFSPDGKWMTVVRSYCGEHCGYPE